MAANSHQICPVVSGGRARLQNEGDWHAKRAGVSPGMIIKFLFKSWRENNEWQITKYNRQIYYCDTIVKLL